MSLKEFKLPDIGEGIAEGEIVSWKVETGQQVKEEDEFVEVMTDKATVMITVPFDGVIKEIKAAEGDVVPVESVIAVIDTAGGGGGGDAAPKEEKEKGQKKEKSQKDEPSAEPDGGSKPTPPPPPPEREKAPAGDGSGGSNGAPFVQASPGKVLAAPATRRRAREMGIDLQAIAGSGPRGRITNDDLAAFQKDGGGAAAPAAAAGGPRFTPISIPADDQGREERVPFRGMRRKIAEAMTRSKFTATHFTYVDDIDVTELVKLRKEAKAMYADDGVNVTFLPFIMKALIPAMKAHPMMNASLDEANDELVMKKYYNFGIATDTDNGLIVPVIKDVDHKTVVELAAELQDLAARTREGKVTMDDLTGGSFSITNAGNIGGLFATPVINFPETAILGVHAIKKTPVVRDGEIVVGDVMYLSVSIDHRIVDGADGARWMNMVKDGLENPKKLLMGSL